jgi:hypothetical protein
MTNKQPLRSHCSVSDSYLIEMEELDSAIRLQELDNLVYRKAIHHRLEHLQRVTDSILTYFNITPQQLNDCIDRDAAHPLAPFHLTHHLPQRPILPQTPISVEVGWWLHQQECGIYRVIQKLGLA